MNKKLLVVAACLALLLISGCGAEEEQAAAAETEPVAAEETAAENDLDAAEAQADAEEAVAVFDVDAVEMQETPDSSCFSEVGYDAAWQVLAVRFRDSGSLYVYYDFPEPAWQQFIAADSLGSHYSSNIKGQYESEQIE